MRATTLALIFTSAAALLAPVAAHAQDRWKYLGTNTQGDSVFMDTKSIARDPGYGTAVWVETRHRKAQTEKGKTYTVSRMRQTFDCDARMVRISAWNAYAKDGSVVASDDVPIALADAKAVPPDSVFEVILEAVCK
jgi:hypothetical protein